MDIDGSSLSDDTSVIEVQNNETKEKRGIKAKLVVDATGRFRRLASKESRLERFEGWNYHAFWAYFEKPGDESDFPLTHYGSCNTNHFSLAKGWAWVIRLTSWGCSSVPNLMRMINHHLLDLTEKKTPSDQYSSAHKLAEMFDLKFRWVVSIGFALRSDVVCPENLQSYGSCEAERKSNVSVRKNLIYQSPKVSGPGWMAIGYAVGFSKPFCLPRINGVMIVPVVA